MDIQKTISDVVSKLQGDKNLLNNFTANPVKTLEDLLCIDLPDDQINAIIAGVKSKLNLGGGLLSKIKGMFSIK